MDVNVRFIQVFAKLTVGEVFVYTDLSTPPVNLRMYEWNDRNFIGGSAFFM